MQSEIDTGLEGREQRKEGGRQSPSLLQVSWVSCVFLGERAHQVSQGLDAVLLACSKPGRLSTS